MPRRAIRRAIRPQRRRYRQHPLPPLSLRRRRSHLGNRALRRRPLRLTDPMRCRRRRRVRSLRC